MTTIQVDVNHVAFSTKMQMAVKMAQIAPFAICVPQGRSGDEKKRRYNGAGWSLDKAILQCFRDLLLTAVDVKFGI